jgi:hypothetical protein
MPHPIDSDTYLAIIPSFNPTASYQHTSDAHPPPFSHSRQSSCLHFPESYKLNDYSVSLIELNAVLLGYTS